ncbi:MAG TPA: class I SAM-dependent methyltransferase [Proteobacteria bacterium]|nr:class I SAM-dependent methyltransferase [Pseudomonadota bacterium]
MDPTYENKRRGLEASYWLFRARRELLVALISQSGGSPDSKVLDAGCGGGLLISLLRKNGFKDIFGIDLSQMMVGLCRERGIMNISRQDCMETTFEDELFDVIIAADVLEHIEDDSGALREWKRILKRDGRLIITVPAFKSLWSSHDEICHHHRRYSKSAMIHLLRTGGFAVDSISFWNFTLFFPVYLMRVLQRWFPGDKKEQGDQLYELKPVINNALLQLLRLENRLLSIINFPIGISIYAVARKIKV